MRPTLANLPDLQPEQLDETLTVRVSRRDRESLERAAAELGTTVSRLLRGLARRALGEEQPAGTA